jgi:hypothetical protein
LSVAKFDSLEDALNLINEAQSEFDNAPYELSENQKQFVADALEQNFEVNFDYSGRGMYGKLCPSITVERYEENIVTEASVKKDALGLDSVVYAQD